jgi:hypothetical protein
LRVWYLLALVGAASFGTGIGIALVLPFVLALLLPAWHARWPPLISLPVVIVLSYVGLIRLYDHLSGTYGVSQGTGIGLLYEWRFVLVFLEQLIGFGFARLMLGYYAPPWLLPPVWYALLALLASAVGIVVWRSPGSVRRRLAALLLLLVACYGMIAVGRGRFGFWGLDMFMRTTRYHYVGQLLLTLVLCVVLTRLPVPRHKGVGDATLVMWFVIALLCWWRFGAPIDHRPDARRATEEVIASIREAIYGVPRGATVRIRNRHFKPLPLSAAAYPGWAATFTIFFPDDVVDGRRVVFVEPRPAVRDTWSRGLRTSTLLVPPPAPRSSVPDLVR